MNQTLSAGAGATAVQVQGDHNLVTIIAGGARFALDRLHHRMDTPRQLSGLLPEEVKAQIVQSMTVSGSGAKGAQVSGDNNSVSM